MQSLYKTFFIVFILFESLPLLSQSIDIHKDWHVKEGKYQDIKGLIERKISESSDESGILTGLENLEILPFIHKRESEIHSKTKTYTLVKYIFIEEDILDFKNRTVSLFLPEAGNQVEIYWNGVLLKSYGKLGEDGIVEMGFRRNINIPIPSTWIVNGDNQLAIQISGFDHDNFYLSPFTENIPARIAYWDINVKDLSENVTLMLLFLYLFVGFYHLLLYGKRRQEKYNLYFGLFSVALSFYIFSRTDSSYFLIEYGLTYMNLRWFELIVLFQAGPLLILFFESFLLGKTSRITFIYLLFVQFLSVLIPFTSYFVQGNVILRTWHICALISVFYALFLVIRATIKKMPDARRLLIGVMVMMVTVILDILGAASLLPQNLGLTKYGFFVFIVGIAFVLANRFLRVHKEVEELNTTLEEKVTARTKELSETLDKVQLLKEQQDGDYFLTSLLLKPLNSNEVKSPKVKIDYFIHQKKQFEFRNRHLEIGGDICMSTELYLLDKKYTVFVNGDAMGKSIQGAGGALVLGVVFKSIVNRTKLFSENQAKFPEVWLKECFIELHNVFESFNGSMLISVVMGLVDEETGLMYFLNAEHPWCVLYRDESASFIEDDLYLRKIGMMDMHGAFQVRTFSMLPGDKIIVGSDGRDDLIVGLDSEGGRIINENENLFLDRVKDGKGEIPKIVESIQKFGELTDDLSLLSIEFDSPNDSEIKSQEREKWKNEFLNHFRKKDFSNAGVAGERYLDLNPIDNQYIYVVSYCHKHAKNYKQAILLGERLRLRDPYHFKNLANLCDIYRLIGDRENAQKYLEKIGKIEPENAMYLKLKTLISKQIPA